MSGSKSPSLEWAKRSNAWPRVENQGKLFDREAFDINAPVYLASGLNVDAAAHFAARESVQNSIDAFNDSAFQAKCSPTPPCRIKFRYVTLVGRDKSAALRALGLNAQDFESRYRVLPAEKDREGVLKKAVERLNRPNNKLRLLYIEEENASGMYHSKSEEVSPFKLYAATLGINESDKDDTAGGSYGQGKTALLAASELALNYVYTEYSWHKEHQHSAALLGFCSWPSHELAGVKYSGYGFIAGNAHSSAPIPYRDDEARKLAEKMGFRRGSRQPGSSTLIVEPAFSCEELEKALLSNWWPALLAGTVRISLSESRGLDDEGDYKELDPRSGPLERELAGFCNAHDNMSTSGLLVEGLGTVGIVEHDQYKPDNPTTVAFVAKMRQIGLVVEYQKVTQARVSEGKAVYGCFQADNEADRVLRRTENKGHTRWDTTQKRDSEGTKKAKSVQEHIKTRIDEFVRAIRQENATSSKVSSVLSDILRNFTNSPELGAGKQPGADVNGRPKRTSSKSTLLHNAQLSSGSDYFQLEFQAKRDVTVSLEFRYVQDGKAQSPVEAIPVQLWDASGQLQQPLADSKYSLKTNVQYTACTARTAKDTVKEIKDANLDAGWQVTE